MLALINSVAKCKRLVLPQITRYKASNPSLVIREDKLLVVYKGVNYDLKNSGYDGWFGNHAVAFTDGQLYMAEITDNFEYQNCAFVEDRHIRARDLALYGLRDLRIFAWKGKTYVAGSAITWLFDKPDQRELTKRCTMILCEFSENGLKLVSFLPSRQQFEKNWMPWVINDDLYFIYHNDPYEILKFNGAGVEMTSIKPTMVDGLKFHSGGSCVIPFKDKFIGVVHRKYVINDPSKTYAQSLHYTHKIVVYTGNFEVLETSVEFSFEKEGIEFCCGLAIQDENIIFSYGIWDVEAVLLKMPMAKLIAALELKML